MKGLNNAEKIITVIVVIACVGYTIYSAVMYQRAKQEYISLSRDCTAQAEGVCVDSDSYTVTKSRRSGTRSHTTYRETHYRSTIEYIVGSKKYRYTEDSKTEYPLNCMTTVNYDPNDPTRAYLGSQPHMTQNEYLRNLFVGPLVLVLFFGAMQRRRSAA